MQKMMTKSALLHNSVKAKASQPMFTAAKRQFSSGGVQSAGQKVAMGVGGMSIAGLTYLSYKGASMRRNMTPQMQLTMFNPIVQQRVRSTFGYFSAACAGTGAFMFMFRNNMRVLNANPWALLALTLGTMVGT